MLYKQKSGFFDHYVFYFYVAAWESYTPQAVILYDNTCMIYDALHEFGKLWKPEFASTCIRSVFHN